MVKKIFILLTIGLVLFLTSCSVTMNPNNNNSNTNGSNKNPFPGYYQIESGLYVNYLPGIYSEEFELDFKCVDEDAKVYYSIDCSIPKATTTNLFREPITVKKVVANNVASYPLTKSVDAILSWDDQGKMQSWDYINNIQKTGKYNLFPKQRVVTINYVNGNGVSKVRSLSYIFGEFDIPVISLSMDYDKWFGTKGIYNNIRNEYEERANFEYFDPEYDEYFYINTQVKLGGNYTIGYPSRILNLNFNKDQNLVKQPQVNAHIFKEQKTEDGMMDLTKFSRLRLHNGGNCFENYTGFNDAILQRMMEGTYATTSSYRPCILYLNGEYWGLYYIREHYKSVYFETNYGIDRDQVAIYDYKGEFIFNDGDMTDFDQFFNSLNSYLDNNNFRNDSVYQKFIDEYIDVESFVDVMIAHLFTCNRDFVGNNNNLKAWRATVINPNNPYADGKLRFCLHDADFAFTDASYWNFLDPDVDDSYSRFKMFKKLLQNQSFKDYFYERACELVDTNLSYEYACQIIDEMTEEVRPYKLDSNNRWGLYYWGNQVNGRDEKGLAGWDYEIQYAKNFVNTRINNKQEFKEENGNQNERNFLDAIFESLKRY